MEFIPGRDRHLQLTIQTGLVPLDSILKRKIFSIDEFINILLRLIFNNCSPGYLGHGDDSYSRVTIQRVLQISRNITNVSITH
ncbi:hypothetical protein ES703_108891 [subsurface metagenome]